VVDDTGPLPANLSVSDDRDRLLRAASKGWVFGGMGSWNDSGARNPELSEEYERVTIALYSALSFAFVAAVNAEQAELCSLEDNR
jgi:hypothetical protein